MRGARRLQLSARGVHRVLRVARTLADLDASRQTKSEHVLEVDLAARVGGRLAYDTRTRCGRDAILPFGTLVAVVVWVDHN